MLAPPETIVITVAPIEARPGYFQAWLADRKLCAASHTPFLDASRALLRLGYPATVRVVMRSPGSTTDRLRSTVGAAARLTVKDRDRGRPAFERWNPISSSPGKAPVRFRGKPAVLPCPTIVGRAPT
jgi:hypothetical protein